MLVCIVAYKTVQIIFVLNILAYLDCFVNPIDIPIDLRDC